MPKLGRIAQRDRGVIFGFDVIARSDSSAVAQRAKAEATKQSILPLWPHGLRRGACHRARIRATRWLAMTVSTRATLSIVIAREGGRSSIPEKSVIELRCRGVLDTRRSLSLGSPKARPGGGYDGYCSRRVPCHISCRRAPGRTQPKAPPGGGGRARPWCPVALAHQNAPAPGPSFRRIEPYSTT